MSPPSLLVRLRRARIVQVLLVYLGASWVVLQMVDTLVGLLSLPDWVGPVAVVLLGIGLLVVLATAWVQSLPSTTAAEEAGEVPTDWEIAPGDVVASLRSGRLPHLTWGRAIVGGMVALSLLVGAAGGVVLLTGGTGLLGPSEAGAEVSTTAVAVLPFQTRGEGLDLYGEGMVDLLTANLEGLGGLRTINAGTVVARWEAEVGETTTAELDEALRVAGGLDARFAIRGSVVAVGGQARLTAEVFDLLDGSRVDGAQVEGPSTTMLELVDALTVRLLAAFVGAESRTASRTPAVNTGSIQALEAYLTGEALFRELRFEEAIDAFRRATVADSLFALAWWGLSESWGWVDPGNEDGLRALARASALSADLPERERTLLHADAEMTRGSNTSIPLLRSYLRRHPDDPDAWSVLGEFATHAPWLSLSPPAEMEEAFRMASELLPSFSPYRIHLLGLYLAEGREEAFQASLARAAEANPADELLPSWGEAWDYMWGTPAERAAAERYFAEAREGDRNLLTLIQLQTDRAAESNRALRFFDPALAEGALVFPPTAVEVSAGVSPDAWPDSWARRGYGLTLWTLITGGVEPALDELRAALAGEVTAEQAVGAAVLAAYAGDDTLRERALELLPDASWDGPYGYFGGAATASQARRTADAVSHLRNGDPAEALRLLESILREPSYDALAVYLSGEAHAALGAWEDAARTWEVLLRSPFRPHVRLRLGRAYEALGESDAALESYRGLLAMWAEADPTLAPVVEARAAVARLTGGAGP